MLDVRKTESDNFVDVVGILKELDIVDGVTADGRGWVRGTAKIAADQDINGKVTPCEVTVKMFSMRLKADGGLNQVYDRIMGYKEKFTSAAAAGSLAEASRVAVKGAKLEENIWIDKNSGQERSGFQISSNFLNLKKESDKEEAKFRLSGVILNEPAEEVDGNGDPTGRLKFKFGVIGYKGKIHVLDLYAQDQAKAHIEANWSKYDTVKIIGKVNSSVTVKMEEINLGFGETDVTPRTNVRRELIVTGGSGSGLEEDLSYDIDSVKIALDERKAEIAKLKEGGAAKAPAKNKPVDLGF